MLSSRTDSLSTCRVKFYPKDDNCWQNNGREAMDHQDWQGKQWWAEHQACRYNRLQRAFCKQSSPFEGLFFTIYCLLNLSFLFQNSTLLCQQNRIFVDVYFLKIAVSFVDNTLVLKRTVVSEKNCCYSFLRSSERNLNELMLWTAWLSLMTVEFVWAWVIRDF